MKQMSKQLQVNFDDIESGDGVVDIAVRYDTNKGEFEFITEENGLPVELPAHVFVGILSLMINCRSKDFETVE